jgi:hypothetical protein
MEAEVLFGVVGSSAQKNITRPINQRAKCMFLYVKYNGVMRVQHERSVVTSQPLHETLCRQCFPHSAVSARAASL